MLGGVNCQEMNLLEGYCLEVLGFTLFVGEQEYAKLSEGLQMHIAEMNRI